MKLIKTRIRAQQKNFHETNRSTNGSVRREFISDSCVRYGNCETERISIPRPPCRLSLSLPLFLADGRARPNKTRLGFSRASAGGRPTLMGRTPGMGKLWCSEIFARTLCCLPLTSIPLIPLFPPVQLVRRHRLFLSLPFFFFTRLFSLFSLPSGGLVTSPVPRNQFTHLYFSFSSSPMFLAYRETSGRLQFKLDNERTKRERERDLDLAGRAYMLRSRVPRRFFLFLPT